MVAEHCADDPAMHALARIVHCADFNEATIARLETLKPDLTLVSMSRIATHPMDHDDDTVAAIGAAVGRMVARIPGKKAIIVECAKMKSARMPAIRLANGAAVHHASKKVSTPTTAMV